MQPNFEKMTRQELRAYILEHREDDEAFYIYADRVTAEPGELYPAVQTIEDLQHFPQLLKEHRARTVNLQTQTAKLQESGILHADRGEVEEAIALFHQSLEISERTGDIKTKAITLCQLGSLAAQQGEYTKAIAYLQPALEILQRIKSPDAEQVGVLLQGVQQQAGGQPF